MYSGISIFGLATAMACCIIVFLHVRNELTYDVFHKNANNIYRIGGEYRPSGGPVRAAVVPGPLGPMLVNEIDEVNACVRFYKDINLESVTVRYNLNSFNEHNLLFVDPTVFSVFTFPLIKGDPLTALQGPGTIVITQHMAQKYFGTEDALGKTLLITMGITHELTVTGIVKNLPENSHIQFNFLVSMASLEKMVGGHRMNWGFAGFYTYALVENGVDTTYLEERINVSIAKHIGDDMSSRIRLFLQPLKSIHLYSNLDDELSAHGDVMQIVSYSTIAVFVLIIACINFMNLSIAHSAGRAREIGIRKVLGAVRFRIMMRILGESVVFALGALFFAFCIIEILLPGFNRVMDTQLSFHYSENVMVFFTMALIAVFVGIVSGSYPSLVVSSFQNFGCVYE